MADIAATLDRQRRAGCTFALGTGLHNKVVKPAWSPRSFLTSSSSCVQPR
jgi:hypothetical protein